MSLNTTIKLVESLSGSEKRHLILQAKKRNGNRYYLDLYRLIVNNKEANEKEIKLIFTKRYPSVSIHNTSTYLTNLITDCLVELKSEKDTLFGLLREYKRVKVLEERFLKEDALKRILKIREKAIEFQHPFLAFLTFREELMILKDDSYRKVSSNTLIEKQMDARDQLKTVFSVHELYSLFEVLEHRMLHHGRITTNREKENLNDLIISELGITNPHLKDNFAAQRLRLNFQATFFTNITDYQSALKTFLALNRLFETNKKLLESPPSNYLASLIGILDSLYMLNQFKEIPFYISKVGVLDNSEYPDYFRNRVQKTAFLYNLIFYMVNGRYSQAEIMINKATNQWLVAYNKIDEKKQWEIYFFIAKVFFELKKFKKTHSWIDKGIRHQSRNQNWVICRAIFLLEAITYYARGERDYLGYVLKNYEREFGKKRLFLSETWLLKFLKEKSKQRPLKDKFVAQLTDQLSKLDKNPYEHQLLKYFDFAQWIRDHLKGFP